MKDANKNSIQKELDRDHQQFLERIYAAVDDDDDFTPYDRIAKLLVVVMTLADNTPFLSDDDRSKLAAVHEKCLQAVMDYDDGSFDDE